MYKVRDDSGRRISDPTTRCVLQPASEVPTMPIGQKSHLQANLATSREVFFHFPGFQGMWSWSQVTGLQLPHIFRTISMPATYSISNPSITTTAPWACDSKTFCADNQFSAEKNIWAALRLTLLPRTDNLDFTHHMLSGDMSRTLLSLCTLAQSYKYIGRGGQPADSVMGTDAHFNKPSRTI
jgi:hypothetical protein